MARKPLDSVTLHRLLARTEDEHIEFKEKLPAPERIADYAVGIGNCGGGLLIVGVTDTIPRQIVGIPRPNETDLHRIKTSIHNSTGVRIELNLVESDGTCVLAVGIPPRPRGHVFCTQTGKYLTRVGESLVGIPPAEVARMLAERSLSAKQLGFFGAVILISVASLVITLHRSRALLSERDSILFADFVNQTNEPELENTIRQAIAVKLQESPFLSIVSDDRVRRELRQMGRPLDQGLTEPLALEFCGRQGLKAVLTGSVATLGSQYVIGLNAIDCLTSQFLSRVQTEANGKEQILRAAAEAAISLRRKLGESLGPHHLFDVPIETATTSSLVALKYYTFGDRELANGDNEAALRFFKRAVEEDHNFAVAHAKMAQAYDNLEENDAAMKAIGEAFSRQQGLIPYARSRFLARRLPVRQERLPVGRHKKRALSHPFLKREWQHVIVRGSPPRHQPQSQHHCGRARDVISGQQYRAK